MKSGLVQIVTELSVVDELEVLARVGRAAGLPLEARGRLSVQLRDPEIPVRALRRFGEALRQATRAVGARLIVNDRVDLALLLEADGVHLGRRSMAVGDARALLGQGAWISTSAHGIEDVVAAARAGADAALLSPIFASPGKGPPLGPEALGEARAVLAREGLSLVVFALGGVTSRNAGLCFAAGADGVAAIRGDVEATLVTV